MLLVFSDDVGLIHSKENELIDHKNCLNFIFDNNIEQIEQEIVQPKLFCDDNYKFILIRNASFMSKKTPSHIEKSFLDFLKKYEKDNNLKIVISCNQNKVSNDYKSYFENVFELKKLNSLTQKNYIKRILENDNIFLDDKILTLLSNKLGFDALIIQTEIEKLKLFPVSEINEELIDKIINSNINENIFKLVDNYLFNQEKEMITQLNFLVEKGTDVYLIFSIFVSQIYTLKMYLLHFSIYKDIPLLLSDFNIMMYQVESWIKLFNKLSINYVDLILKNLLELNKEFLIGKKDILISFRLFLLKGVVYED